MQVNNAVQTQNLYKKFPRVTALQDITVDIPRGIVYALLGPNGSGKTTFLKTLLGLMRPSQGKAWCLGLDIYKKSANIRKRVGYIGEEPRFYNYLTVDEFINLCRGLHSNWDQKLAQHYLGKFKLPGKEKIKHLSQGMKNQLALITAIAPQPEILLLDEPTAGYDPLLRRDFLNVILAEIVAAGKTVIISSHQLMEIERYADQVGFLKDGKLLFSRPLVELKTSEKDIRVVFKKHPPEEIFHMQGIRQVKRRDNAYFISISGNLENIHNNLLSIPHFSLEILDKSLEDIFFLYMGKMEEGGKRYG